MVRKLIYAAAALLAVLASAQAASRNSSTTKIQYILEPQPNGDYRLFLFGGINRNLVCEEKNITIVSQGDAVNPLVLECRH